jgi:hypothetical protein
VVERLVYSEICGDGRRPEQLFDIAARLLEHSHDCSAIVEQALERARLQLGFTSVARRVQSFFGQFNP